MPQHLGSKYGVTQALLRELFDFDPQSRRLVWRRTGKVAGSVDKRRRVRYVKIGEHNYSANQLVYLYIYGSWPAGDVVRKYPTMGEEK